MTAVRRARPGRLLVTVGAFLAMSGTATAAAVPGATYTGTASDGATVTLTVSSNGATVASYRVLGIFGTDSNGQQCQGTAAEVQGGWLGAPISGDAFQDSIAGTFSMSGTFAGAQSVSGTFDLNQPAQGGSPGCATGAVAWTASATSSGGGSGTSKKKAVSTRLSLRRLSHEKLVGTVKSSATACESRRMIYLWAGRRRLGHVRSTKKGAFSFATRRWGGRRVHATIADLSTKTVICRSAASTTIRS